MKEPDGRDDDSLVALHLRTESLAQKQKGRPDELERP
jgi:hypothetical protein